MLFSNEHSFSFILYTHSWQLGYGLRSWCWLGCWPDTGRCHGWRSEQVEWTLSCCLRRSWVGCFDAGANHPSSRFWCWWSRRRHRWGWRSSCLLSGCLQGCEWWLLLSELVESKQHPSTENWCKILQIYFGSNQLKIFCENTTGFVSNSHFICQKLTGHQTQSFWQL